MGYVNLSIYMGKTSKKVLGPKDVNVGQTNILEPRNLNCFTLHYNSGLKLKVWPQNGLKLRRYRSELSFAKKIGVN